MLLTVAHIIKLLSPPTLQQVAVSVNQVRLETGQCNYWNTPGDMLFDAAVRRD